jgi:hypothetical protein
MQNATLRFYRQSLMPVALGISGVISVSAPVRAQPKAGASQAAAPGPGTQGPTVTSSLATICQGGSAVLTATPGTVSGPNVTYAWSPNVALSATSGARVVVNPLQTTTYTVAVTADGLTTTRTVTPTPL